MFTVALTIFSILGSVIGETNPIIQTINGKVRGAPLKTYNDNNYYAFQGIPFAEPPVGALRFQAPQPPRNWEGVLDGENINKKCIQGESISSPGETEDCLYLNVYTPQLPTSNKNVSLPVMVFIHGGAFVMGSASIDQVRPYRVMDYGIVLVTVQYRLGFFGFLSTGDLECPGNNGFKDQQLSIKWVKENIRNFGGDPTKITISGNSAGAASVGYQLLGSNAEGLFRGVIQSSGSSLGTWTLQRDPKGYAYQVANYIEPSINEENTSTKNLIQFLRNTEVPLLKKACEDIFGKDQLVSFLNTFKGYVFSGVIEPEHDGAFLTKTAFEKFESGNFNVVPTLIGIVSEESLYFVDARVKREFNLSYQIVVHCNIVSPTDSLVRLGMIYKEEHSYSYRKGAKIPEFSGVLKEYDESPELFVTPDMHITDLYVKRSVGQDIRRFYVGDGLLQDNIGPSMKMISDGGFGKPNIKQAQLASKYTDVYFYEFAYSGLLGRRGEPETHIPGADTVAHGTDMEYIFPAKIEQFRKYPEQDILASDRYLRMWTNFVKYLNPTPEPSDVLENVIWPKVTPNSFPYLLINETLEVKYDLKKSMMNEYAKLYNLYAVPPRDTY